ncbi:MAG: Holliday junction branch migration protein RuvA [Waddliaceae bacterium]
MIRYMKGMLALARPGSVVVEVGGIGYQLLIPASLYPALPQLGKEIFLHTSLIVRDFSQTLYGFPSEGERDLFDQVVGVSGIGPKIALSLIGHLSLEEMLAAIKGDDIQTISRVPGIGKKTAQRLIMEMRDRLMKSFPSSFSSDVPAAVDGGSNVQKITDAVNALLHLGYKRIHAHQAVKQSLKTLPDSCDLSTLITDALKHV